MNMSKSTAIITHYKNKILYAYIADDVAVDIKLFAQAGETLGSIYVATVSRILNNISSSFVLYQKGKSGFMRSADYPCGSLVPVMLKSEQRGEKDPLVTDELSLSGQFCVISTKKPYRVSVSSKLPDDIRKALQKEYAHYSEEKGVSVILRTNSADADKITIQTEIEMLCDRLNDIIAKSKNHSAYSILYSPPSGYIKDLHNIRISGLDEIVTDDEAIFEELRTEIFDVNIRLYKDNLVSLIKLYAMEAKLSKALSDKVYLRSGAYIVIEQTEAFVSIDVNSGNITAKNETKEDAFLRVNLEAAAEISRQIRLRNLSGTILIDFINMDLKSDYDKLINVLKECTQKDTSRVNVIDITALGIAELTRERKGLTLCEQMRN